MNQLTQAISSGYSSEQILEFLFRKFPKYSKDIQKALNQGFTANQVLKYLGNGRKGVNEFEGELTEHEKTRKSDIDKQRNLEKNIGKGALALGGAALGAYGLSRGAGSIATQVLPAVNQNFNPRKDVEIDATPRIAQQEKQIEFQPPNELIQESRLPKDPNETGLASQTQTIPQPPQLDIVGALDSLGIRQRIDSLRQNNSPEIVAKAARYTTNNNAIKELESHLQMPFEKIVLDYMNQSPVQQKEIKKETEIYLPNEKKIGSTVLLPDGEVGDIQSIKNGIAKVNIDGKERHKKIDELVESPLPSKDLGDLYKDLLTEIEKKSGQQVSRNVYWAGYDPKTNELAFIPHHGSLYVYKDISPEDAEQLTSFLTQRKSSGENYIGAWTSGSKSPIGAAMYQLIQRLQKQSGGKGKEYYGKYEKIYDALEIAKLEAKKKEDEKRKKQTKRKA